MSDLRKIDGPHRLQITRNGRSEQARDELRADDVRHRNTRQHECGVVVRDQGVGEAGPQSGEPTSNTGHGARKRALRKAEKRGNLPPSHRPDSQVFGCKELRVLLVPGAHCGLWRRVEELRIEYLSKLV